MMAQPKFWTYIIDVEIKGYNILLRIFLPLYKIPTAFISVVLQPTTLPHASQDLPTGVALPGCVA
jgi:hypothetical protein